MNKIKKIFSNLKNSSGQTSVGYVLVLATLALALGVMINSPQMRQSISQYYQDAASRILSPD